MKKVFICLTSGGNWGKSENLFDAILNAKAQNRIDVELVLVLVETNEPENVGVNDMGGICYNQDDKVIYLTEPKKCPKISMFFNLDNTCDYVMDKVSDINFDTNYEYQRLYDLLEDFKEENC